MTINMELAKKCFGEGNVRVYDQTFTREGVLSILSEENALKLAYKLLYAFTWSGTPQKFLFWKGLHRSLTRKEMNVWLKEGKPLFQQLVILQPVLSLEEML